jgi:hypothetical protein
LNPLKPVALEFLDMVGMIFDRTYPLVKKIHFQRGCQQHALPRMNPKDEIKVP